MRTYLTVPQITCDDWNVVAPLRGCSERTIRATAENLREHVEEAICRTNEGLSSEGYRLSTSTLTLDRALERLDAVRCDVERLPERLPETRCEHEVEQVVHVLREDHAERLRQHANALIDRILWRRVLFPARRVESAG